VHGCAICTVYKVGAHVYDFYSRCSLCRGVLFVILYSGCSTGTGMCLGVRVLCVRYVLYLLRWTICKLAQCVHRCMICTVGAVCAGMYDLCSRYRYSVCIGVLFV
jgi:hypothetical protein